MQRFLKKPSEYMFYEQSHVSDQASQDTGQHADVVLGGATVPAISRSSRYPQHGTPQIHPVSVFYRIPFV